MCNSAGSVRSRVAVSEVGEVGGAHVIEIVENAPNPMLDCAWTRTRQIEQPADAYKFVVVVTAVHDWPLLTLLNTQ